MIDYIKGNIVELSPTDVVVECYGIGYHAFISLQTYTALEGRENITLYIHHILREDEEMFYGFANKEERQFLFLINQEKRLLNYKNETSVLTHCI